MHDAERVRARERLARLKNQIDRIGDGNGAALIDSRGEISALEKLHHDVRQFSGGRFVRADVEDACDVLAADFHGGSALAQKSRDDVGIARAARMQHFDRDGLVKLAMLGRENDAHSAFAEHALEAVFAAELVAHSHGQCDFGRALGAHAPSI